MFLFMSVATRVLVHYFCSSPCEFLHPFQLLLAIQARCSIRYSYYTPRGSSLVHELGSGHYRVVFPIEFRIMLRII